MMSWTSDGSRGYLREWVAQGIVFLNAFVWHRKTIAFALAGTSVNNPEVRKQGC